MVSSSSPTRSDRATADFQKPFSDWVSSLNSSKIAGILRLIPRCRVKQTTGKQENIKRSEQVRIVQGGLLSVYLSLNST